MDLSELLLELYGRVHDHVHEVVAGLDDDDLVVQPEPGSNPIGWELWHLARVEDMHISEILETDQLWVRDDWGPRLAQASEQWNVGFGHTAEMVASVRPESPQALIDYYEAVAARTRSFLATVTAADLDRIVDRRFDPPVTMGVRLVSIVDDAIQHAGHAAYVKGMLQRRGQQ